MKESQSEQTPLVKPRVPFEKLLIGPITVVGEVTQHTVSTINEFVHIFQSFRKIILETIRI